MIKIAVITVNYNGKPDTLELLHSLQKLRTKNYELRTIVVDNGSDDGLVEELIKNYPEVEVLQNGQNLGFAGGYNRGLDYGQVWGADYFLIINNDSLIKDAGLLEELIKTAQANKNIGIVSPKIYFAPGFEFYKERYKKTDFGKVIWYAGGHFDWDNIMAVHRGIDEVDNGKYDSAEEVDFASGACMLIKKEVLGRIGGFDKKYFLYFEDADFLKRVKEAGFKIYYNGKAAIYHKVSQSTGVGSLLTDYYHTRNRLIFGMQYAVTRTKLALLREALYLFIFGRPAQRRGILDFYLGVNSSHPRGVIASHPLKMSICIVNFKTANLTKKLLQSIFKKESGFDEKNMEVIVLDNGSNDNLKEIIKEFLPRLKFIQNKENEGFSKGYNKNIKFSRGQYILLLNSDIEVTKNSLSEILKWAEHFEGQAVLGGKLVFPDGSKQNSAFHLPSIWGAFKEYFLAKKGSYFMYEPSGDKPLKVEGLVMACFLIPRNIINKVGLLDESTFIYFEDIEYCRRLLEFGVPVYFIPQAKFIHHHGASSKTIGQGKSQELLQKAALHYHGKLYYFLLSLVLKIGQKLGRVKTPVSRWTAES